jgi:predicted secreted protein
MRLLFILIAVWFVVLGCGAFALAGDHATFAPLGYSEDRHFFAYEEFSIGDEATAPFATIGIIDMTTGAHVEGSPWMAGGTEETAAPLSTLRLEATNLASRALAKAAIDDPGEYLALIGDGVRDDGNELSFALPQGSDPDALGPGMILDIMGLPAMIKDRCSPYDGGYAAGIILLLLPEDRSTSRRLLHQDAADGAEDCVRRFKLYSVVRPYNGGDVASLVAVLSVFTVGFEGYDRRFMVIPLGANP